MAHPLTHPQRAGRDRRDDEPAKQRHQHAATVRPRATIESRDDSGAELPDTPDRPDDAADRQDPTRHSRHPIVRALPPGGYM